MTPIRRRTTPPGALPWCAAPLLVGILISPARAAEPQASAPPVLAGVWKLDLEKSDSAQKKMEETRRAGGRGAWGGRGGGMRGGMGGGMGGRRGGGGRPRGPGSGPPEDEAQGAARGPEMRLMMRPPVSMLIEQSDSTVVLFEQGLPLEVLVLGLPQDRAGTVEPETMHIPASWSGRRLLAIREDERGGRASQELTLSPDGKSLTVILRREPREDGMPPLEIKREYAREDAE